MVPVRVTVTTIPHVPSVLDALYAHLLALYHLLNWA
jgi:hypothetical protein